MRLDVVKRCRVVGLSLFDRRRSTKGNYGACPADGIVQWGASRRWSFEVA